MTLASRSNKGRTLYHEARGREEHYLANLSSLGTGGLVGSGGEKWVPMSLEPHRVAYWGHIASSAHLHHLSAYWYSIVIRTGTR